MSFFGRVWNAITSFFTLGISRIEERNPELVYETAINERIKKHAELKKAIANILYIRNKTQSELEAAQEQLSQVNLDLETALDVNDDEAAEVLISRQMALQATVTEKAAELQSAAQQAEDAKQSLSQFRTSIEELKREKDKLIAQAKTDEAKLKIQETLDGLSLDADVQALTNVRESIEKKVAEAEINDEMNEDGIDNRLAEIRQRTQNTAARRRLEEMKRQRAAQSAAAEEVKKTI